MSNNDDVIKKSLNRALGGGIAGASAMFIQVGSLMWLRTTMNYQYRYGTTTKEAIKHLYKDILNAPKRTEQTVPSRAQYFTAAPSD